MHKSHYHCIYSITYHLVLITKDKNACLNDDITKRLNSLIRDMCDKSYLEVQQINSASNHVHIVIEAHPNIMPSKFVTSLKTVTSRYIRKEFGDYLDKVNCKTGLWARGYGFFTAGKDVDSEVSSYINTA